LLQSKPTGFYYLDYELSLDLSLTVSEIAEESSSAELYTQVAGHVYRDDPHYVRQSYDKIQQSLGNLRPSERKAFFVANSGGRPVATACCRFVPSVDSESNWGTIGMFESVNDSEAASTLLREAALWLYDQGATQIAGPMDGDTWHRYRFNLGPTDETPFFMEPHNPVYYPRLWENAGFLPLEQYHSKRLEDVTPVVEKFQPIHTRLQQRGYELQPFDLNQFENGLRRLFQLSLAIFAQNKLYRDISWEQFRVLYDPMKSVLDSRLAWFATSPDGEDVGFLFAIHDYHAAAVAMQGKSNLLAKMRFVLNRHKAKAINLKSMGVVSGHRRSGVGVALVCEVYRQMLAMGYKRANLCLIHDDNPSSRLDGGYASILRRYCLYRYQGSN
jgi:GNAT superfamily N-acetyltransferase